MILQFGSPIMQSLQSCFQQGAHQEYLYKRDVKYHNEECHWRQTTPQLYARVFNLSSSSLVKRSTFTKILYDWAYHGGNRHKSAPITSDTDIQRRRCDNCHYSDSNYHWICQCTHPPSMALRNQVIRQLYSEQEDLNKLYNSLSEPGTPNDKNKQEELYHTTIYMTVLRFYTQFHDSPTWGERLWTSNWTELMIEDLTNRIILPRNNDGTQYIKLSIVNTLRSAIVKYGKILANGIEEIWKSKASTISTSCKSSQLTPNVNRKVITNSKSVDLHPGSKQISIQNAFANSHKISPSPAMERPIRSTRNLTINYNEDVPIRTVKQRLKIFHDTDTYANKRMYISKSDIPGHTGYGGFANRRLKWHEIIGEYKLRDFSIKFIYSNLQI